MPRPILAPIAIVAAAGALAPSAYGWADKGHMMVAWIAYQQLDAAGKQKALDILKGNPTLFAMLEDGLPKKATPEERDLYIFMRAATWADMVRDAKSPMHAENHPAWHFINYPLAFDGKQRKDPAADWKPGEEPKNILQALAKCESDLKDPALPKEERAIRLCWMLHLVGDLHQPLHAVALFSDRYAKGDEGGNREWVRSEGKALKLHAYWDELPGTSHSPAVAANAALQLTQGAKLSRAALAGDLAKAAYADWAGESRELAKAVAYANGAFPAADAEATEKDPAALPKGYAEAAGEVADRRVAVAGYRLGEKLRRVFGGN